MTSHGWILLCLVGVGLCLVGVGVDERRERRFRQSSVNNVGSESSRLISRNGWNKLVEEPAKLEFRLQPLEIMGNY